VFTGFAACGGPTTVETTTTCYVSDGTFDLDRGDGTLLHETGVTDGFPYACASFIDSAKHFGLVLTSGHVGERVFRVEYLFTLGLLGAASSFEVVPWSVSRKTTLNQYGAEFDEFGASGARAGTVMVEVSEWILPSAPDGSPTRQWTSSGGGTIQADPAHWWTGIDSTGTVRLNHAALALSMVSPGSAASAVAPAGGTGSFLGFVAVGGSNSKFQCAGDGIQSGGASCVTFLQCTPDASTGTSFDTGGDATPTQVCPPDCMACGPAVNGARLCCILDGKACPGEGTPCCSGHCKNQICMNDNDAATYDAKCTGGGPGTCKSVLGGACTKQTDCCAEPAKDDPNGPPSFPLNCVENKCCRFDTYWCRASSDCCAPETCVDGFCG
jgi:hypothetical protein